MAKFGRISKRTIKDLELIAERDSGAQAQDVSPTDAMYLYAGSDREDTATESPTRHYAITVNIKPTQHMNKRQWKLYTADEQRRQLLRIERSLRTKTPSIELKEIHFEECPKLHNQHFHALYKMPPMFKAELQAYYTRVCNKGDVTGWRVLDCQLLEDDESVKRWEEYIRKDE